MGDQRDDDRFVRIETRLSSVEADMSEVMSWKDRVDADLYNHGRDGLKTQFLTYVSEQRGREKEMDRTQDIRHAQNSEKLEENAKQLAQMANMLARKTMLWTVAGVLVGAAALVGMVVEILFALKVGHP